MKKNAKTFREVIIPDMPQIDPKDIPITAKDGDFVLFVEKETGNYQLGYQIDRDTHFTINYSKDGKIIQQGHLTHMLTLKNIKHNPEKGVFVIKDFKQQKINEYIKEFIALNKND